MSSFNEQPTQHYLPVEAVRRRSGRAVVAGALLIGLVAGGAAGGIVARVAAPAPTTITRTVVVNRNVTGAVAAPAAATTLPPLRLVDTSDRVVQVVARVSPAVVTINTTGVDANGNNFQASGSGVIIDGAGDILTNYHVVQGSNTSFKVVFKSGASTAATMVGNAPWADLAIIHVNAKVPAWAPLGDSSKVRPGQTVLAMGSPLGSSFENTVTHGIISAVGRTLTEPNGTTLTGVLQTDAPINHGNSGGPLVDLNGQVIGINTAVVRSSSDANGGTPNPQDPFSGLLDPFTSSTSDPAQGLGFAIPSNTARSIISRVLFHLAPGFLGVEPQAILDPQTAAYYNLPVGAIVKTVEKGTPADKAGLRPHDIITAVDGQAIDQNHDLRTVIEMHQPGSAVKLSVFRAGRSLTIDVKLAARPKSAGG